MRVTKNPVLDIATLRWCANDGVEDHRGFLVWCGGPSAEAKANEAAQTNFYNQMVSQQSEVFAQQQDILKQIQNVATPFLQAGPEQPGFSPELDAALKSKIETGGARAEEQALNALELKQRQQSGGAPVLPSGTADQQRLIADTLTKQNTEAQKTQETIQNYAQGNTNYQQALAALSGNASLLAPTSYASTASGAGEQATGAVKLADSERSTLLSSLLGGVIGAGTSFLTGGLSNIAGGGGFLSPAG